jgi:hypothetical protein
MKQTIKKKEKIYLDKNTIILEYQMINLQLTTLLEEDRKVN